MMAHAPVTHQTIDAPAILLLHGFPTSSQMFRNLMPQLAGEYRVVAPDYPGFGHSAYPRARSSTTRSTTSRA
jgi:pimeloyl-ACP methyl ester carboxylesterase